MPNPYTYTISTDLPGGKVNPAKLRSEIELAALATGLDYVLGPVDTSDDTLTITFLGDLSAADKTTLDGDTSGPAGGLLAAHDNTSSAGVPKKVDVTNFEVAPDARLVVSLATFERGLQTYYTSTDDNVVAGTRGDGALFTLTQSGAGTAIRDNIQFIDEVFIVGGRMWVKDAFLEDYVSFECHALATPVAANGTTTGNCNLVDIGGGAMMIVPAAGTGTHDVDLTKALNANLAAKSKGHPTLVTEASPIPAAPTASGTNTGYWDYDRVSGAITAAAIAGQGAYNLMNFPLTLMRWVNRLSIWDPLGNAVRSLEVPIRDSLVLPHWLCRVTLQCDNADIGTRVGAWKFNMGRKETT